MPTLLFIDTNIFLDYYRFKKSKLPGGISLLRKVNKNLSRIITTDQVEMEFKKNRGQVIVKTMEKEKLFKLDNLADFIFLRIAKDRDLIHRLEQIGKLSNELNRCIDKCIDKFLRDPTSSDGVYQTLERFFRGPNDYHLRDQNPARSRIHRLAFKRFIMGYPPRKTDDTSMGDAINWEWVVYCAKQSKADVVIVSRDSDYGIPQGEHSILKDWLFREFQERVGFDHKIILTHLLSKAFEIADIAVSKKELDEEKELVEELSKNTMIHYRDSFDPEVCPKCGRNRVLNRTTKEYRCKACGYSEDADLFTFDS